MRLAKSVLGRCLELVLRRRSGSTEAHVSVTKEPSWDQLSDEQKDARLHDRA